ncbi:MAG: FGGY-family carbohydrate kinase [Ignavibacteriales bacterium]|nr:FGGY-family carbohydrate kinase [Ignavibacteriales bacterium]
MNTEFVIGVDVGTGSVRAGVFDLNGSMAASSTKDIQIWKPQEFFVEQSSDDIWAATSLAIREALGSGTINPQSVIGISFDATCSLVALAEDDKPISVSPTGSSEQNIIVWMDHRAVHEAEEINATRHRMLRFVGKKVSPEMEPPKLLWLKRNMPQTWNNSSKFLDLADFMVYRSTGIDVRSLCTTVCKWAYDGEKGMWDRGFFQKIGLDSLVSQGKIGSRILPMGTHVGNLSEQAAKDFGLTTATKVAVGIIDAHAGGIGVMGMGFNRPPKASQLQTILALIGGTSSCHMAVSARPRFIPGIWGPYPSAMIPGLWLTEGGQSATGSLLDHVIHNNSAYPSLAQEAEKHGQSVYDYLNSILQGIKGRQGKGPQIVKDINILPYFLGNRSPHADPGARGVVNGLTLDESVEKVARLYYATIQSIAYGTRHIIEEMNRHGYRIRRIHACGGGTKNPLWLQEHADITGCKILLPQEPEAVLVGTAMLAAVGAGKFSSIEEASVRMSHIGSRITPERKFGRFHDAKYGVFQRMYNDFKSYQKALEKF